MEEHFLPRAFEKRGKFFIQGSFMGNLIDTLKKLVNGQLSPHGPCWGP
jgi:hypothetical protein